MGQGCEVLGSKPSVPGSAGLVWVQELQAAMRSHTSALSQPSDSFSSCNSQPSLAWTACSRGTNGLYSPSAGHHQCPSYPSGKSLPFTPHLFTSRLVHPMFSHYPKLWRDKNLRPAAARPRHRKQSHSQSSRSPDLWTQAWKLLSQEASRHLQEGPAACSSGPSS